MVYKKRIDRRRIQYKIKKVRPNKHKEFIEAHRHLYEELLELQDGVCALCGRPPKTRRLDMDHDHLLMKIRGLLCHRCNRNLPHWVTVDWLERAIIYLTTEI